MTSVSVGPTDVVGGTVVDVVVVEVEVDVGTGDSTVATDWLVDRDDTGDVVAESSPEPHDETATRIPMIKATRKDFITTSLP